MNSKLFACFTFSRVCVLWNPVESVLYKTALVCPSCAGRLFVCIQGVTNPFSCYIPFLAYAGSKYRSTDEDTELTLTNCLRSALTLRHLVWKGDGV